MLVFEDMELTELNVDIAKETFGKLYGKRL